MQPGGFPPGGYPPGSQPGGFPPGVPAGAPPGFQPGGFPPGAPPGYPPGAMPPGGMPGYGYPFAPQGVFGNDGADGFGRDTLLGNRPVESPDHYALQNNKMLRVRLNQQHTQFFAKSGSMVAYQGGVNFEGNTESWAQDFMRSLTGARPAIMKVSGQGDVWLAAQAQEINILTLHNESFIVDKDNLLAFSTNLRWDIVRIDSTQSIGGMDNYNLELTGTGTFCLATPGSPLVMRVTPNNYYFADADAVVGWSGHLSTQLQSNTISTGVWRPRGNTGESWQVQFSGDGFVVIQPSEVLPPYNALEGSHLQQVFGPGTAFRGNQLGNAGGRGLGALGGGLGDLFN